MKRIVEEKSFGRIKFKGLKRPSFAFWHAGALIGNVYGRGRAEACEISLNFYRDSTRGSRTGCRIRLIERINQCKVEHCERSGGSV